MEHSLVKECCFNIADTPRINGEIGLMCFIAEAAAGSIGRSPVLGTIIDEIREKMGKSKGRAARRLFNHVLFRTIQTGSSSV